MRESPKCTPCQSPNIRESPKRTPCDTQTAGTSHKRAPCDTTRLGGASPKRMPCETTRLGTSPKRTPCETTRLGASPKRTPCETPKVRESPKRAACDTQTTGTFAKRARCEIQRVRTSLNHAPCEPQTTEGVPPKPAPREKQTVGALRRRAPSQAQAGGACHSDARPACSVPEKSDLFRELKQRCAEREALLLGKEEATQSVPPPPPPPTPRQRVRPLPRICIIPQRQPGSNSPQKICIIPQQTGDSIPTQKICIIPQQNVNSKSFQKVCIIPQQQHTSTNSVCPTGGAEKEDPMSSQTTCTISVENDESRQRCAAAVPAQSEKTKSRAKSRHRETRDCERQTSNGPAATVDPARFSPPNCEPCATEYVKQKILSAKHTPVRCSSNENNRLQSDFTMVQSTQRRPAWGNVEDVFENRRNRSRDTGQRPIVSVHTTIREAYERCVKGKPKARRGAQTRSDQTVSQSKGRNVATSESEQRHVKTLRHTVLTEDALVREQMGDCGHITLMPFVFPFLPKSRPGGNPPSSDTDHSNSARRGSSESIQNTQPASSSCEKKEPYKCLSKASIKEPSPPWEVSERAKNNVFSPVGWTSPRSGITSLFRGQGHEKMDQINETVTLDDGVEKQSLKVSNTERTPCPRHLSQDASENTTGHPIIHSRPSDEPQQKASGFFRPFGDSSFLATGATEVCSSVKTGSPLSSENDVSNEQHDSDVQAKPPASWSPEVKAGTSASGGEDLVQAESEHRPRIMSRLKPTSKSRLPGPLSASICGDPFPSRPRPFQCMAASSSGTDTSCSPGGQTGRTPPRERDTADLFGERDNTLQLSSRDNTPLRTTSERLKTPQACERKQTLPLAEKDMALQSSGGGTRALASSARNKKVQPREKGESVESSQRAKISRSSSSESELKRLSRERGPSLPQTSHSSFARHKLCQYPNSSNTELKGKLCKTQTPSDINKGKRKRDTVAVARSENIRSQMAAKDCEDVPACRSRPTPQKRLPVCTHRPSHRKRGGASGTSLGSDSARETLHSHTEQSDAKAANETDVVKANTKERLLSKPNSDKQSSIPVSTSCTHTQGKQISGKSAAGDTGTQMAVSVDHKLKPEQSCSKLSRIPVTHMPREDNATPRLLNAQPKLEMAATSRTAIAEPATEGTCTVSEKQAAVSLTKSATVEKPITASHNPGAATWKEDMTGHKSCKITSSKLPLAQSASSLDDHSPETSDTLKTNQHVSSLISNRIRLLQMSILEPPNTIPREGKPIGKLSEYVEADDSDGTLEAKIDVKDDAKGHEENFRPTHQVSDRTRQNSQRQVSLGSPSRAAHGEVTLTSDTLDKYPEKTRKRPRHFEREPDRFAPHTEGDISQNHNSNESSCESVTFAPEVDIEASLSPGGSRASTPDLWNVQLITSTDEEQNANKSDWFCSLDTPLPLSLASFSAPELHFTGVTEELKYLAKKHGGQVYPSQAKQLSTSFCRQQKRDMTAVDRPNTRSTRHEVGDRQTPQFPCNIEALTFLPVLARSRMAQRSNQQNRHRRLKRCRSTSALPSAKFSVVHPPDTKTSGQQLLGQPESRIADPNGLSRSPCPIARLCELGGETTMDKVNSFLSAQCSLLGDSNPPEVLRVIGPPQANSSFMEDRVEPDPLKPSSDGSHQPGLGLDGGNVRSGARETLSVDPQREGGVRSVKEGWGPGSVRRVPLTDEKQFARRRDWSDLSGASDVPITGSLDVMSTFLATFSKRNDHHRMGPIAGDLDQLDDEEVLQDVSDISRDLRFYGHSVSVV